MIAYNSPGALAHTHRTHAQGAKPTGTEHQPPRTQDQPPRTQGPDEPVYEGTTKQLVIRSVQTQGKPSSWGCDVKAARLCSAGKTCTIPKVQAAVLHRDVAEEVLNDGGGVAAESGVMHDGAPKLI